MTTVLLNNELKGIEIYFGSKPEQSIINSLKTIGYRWHGIKKCWYAKQNENTLAEANKFALVIPEEVKPVITKTKKENKLSLWDLTTWNDIEVNNKLHTKEIAAEIRKHVRNRFPMCKFSVTSDYSSISFYITASPFENKSVYLEAIVDYCTKLIEAYHYCTYYDPYGDYGSSYNFYGAYAKIDYSYTQTELTEEIKNSMVDFDNKKAEFEKLEEERKEAEYQEYLIKEEQSKKEYELRKIEESKQVENIYSSVEVKELEQGNQYYVIGSQFAHLNKNQSLEQYEEEVDKGEYELQDVKITRELHFSSEKALNDFSNLLLNDFTFIEGTGGSFTDDNRINSMTDYYNMAEEKYTVKWYLQGIAVYYNNELQFIIDAQGYSYSRYVGLVENVKIQKFINSDQVLNEDEKKELELKADTLTDISTSVICDNNLQKVWNNEKFSEYKQLMKEALKRNEFKLTKSIIQQLSEDMEELKVAMYRLLVEVDSIQEQFKNANIQEGQKVTLFYIGDLGGITQQRITLNRVEYTKYAQYDNAVKLTFTPEGKKKQYYNYWYSTILVYNGWLELPESVLNNVEDNDRFHIIKSKYSSCDKEQYDEIIEYFATQNIKPIVNTYKPEL